MIGVIAARGRTIQCRPHPFEGTRKEKAQSGTLPGHRDARVAGSRLDDFDERRRSIKAHGKIATDWLRWRRDYALYDLPLRCRSAPGLATEGIQSHKGLRCTD